MVQRILPIIAFSLILISCGSTKNANGQSSSEGTDQSIVFPDVATGDSLFAHIKKGYCFGTCPVYEIYIYNSGHTVLKGTRNVELLGDHTMQLSKREMLAFIEKAKEIKYFEMEDKYDNPHITDLPETVTSIVADGQRKEVSRRYGFPASIRSFEKLFEDLLESKAWSPGLQER